jgi:uncharacterized protein with von Willebrand factor type A (vWA) domain
LFFGEGNSPPLTNLSENLAPEEAEMLAEALKAFSQRLREMMARMMSGDPLSQEELDILARRVGMEGISDMRYREWMVRRMQQALRFRQVREALEELLELLEAMGMDGDRLNQIRQVVGQNQEALEDQIRQYVGQQIAERLSEQDPQESLDGLLNRPFESLSDQDMHRLRKEVQRLAALLRTRVALRQKRAKSGQLDAKSTIRQNLKHGSVPIKLVHRDRHLKPKLIVICDISTSMRPMSEMMLSFLYSMQDLISKTHAFAFIDHLEYISPDFSRFDSATAVTKVLERMPSGYYNTDLGNSLNDFNRDFLDTVDRRSTFILVGDGRNNYNNPRLDIFRKVARRSNRTIWINPEPRSMWGTGDSDMLAYEPLCDQVLQVSTMAELTRAIDRLLA